MTGAASLALQRTKKARRSSGPRSPGGTGWARRILVVTSQRLVFTPRRPLGLVLVCGDRSAADWQPGRGGVPSVQFQPSGAPTLRLDFARAPLLYVFVHHLVDGRPPGVPMPPGLLERAQAQAALR